MSKIVEQELQGKLSVKHWLRKDRPVVVDDLEKYPIYVRVTFQRKQKDFPSQFEEILSGSLPHRIPDFPIERQLSQLPEARPNKEYFSEAEFIKVMNSKPNQKTLHAKKMAIDEEHRRILAVAELLRRHNFNYAERQDSGFLQDQLTHPITYALESHFKRRLFNFLASGKFLENRIATPEVIDWHRSFNSIYSGIMDIGKESLRSECKLQFSHLVVLFEDLEQFKKAFRIGILCYEYADPATISKLNEYYDSVIQDELQARAAHQKVVALKLALEDYFANLGELGSRLFRA